MAEKKKSFFFANTGRMALTVVIAAVVIAFALYKLPVLWSGINKIISIVKPFIYGGVIAYILMPCYNFFVRHTYNFFERQKWKKARTLSKIAGLLGCFLIIILVIFLLLGVIIPQLAQSIISIVSTQNIAQNAQAFFNDFLQMIEENAKLTELIVDIYNNIYDTVSDWVQNYLMSFSEEVLLSFSGGLIGLVSFLKNFGIGLIIAIYIFYGRENFIAGFKKMLYSLASAERADLILDDMRFCNKIFSGFISGKLLDSLIVGVLSFIILSVIKMPYALLLSVIVGVTNIIPFFGPILGAIPCAILLVLIDPIKCLEFIIFACAIQVVDGYIVGPKILGQSIGLSSFWVLFAILLFGGLFGFIGMIVGVPVFAVIYNFILRFINNNLKKKGIDDEKVDYYNLTSLSDKMPLPAEGGEKDAN